MEPPTCPTCGGNGTFLGKLGCSMLWFRCRQCGIDYCVDENDETGSNPSPDLTDEESVVE